MLWAALPSLRTLGGYAKRDFLTPHARIPDPWGPAQVSRREWKPCPQAEGRPGGQHGHGALLSSGTLEVWSWHSMPLGNPGQRKISPRTSRGQYTGGSPPPSGEPAGSQFSVPSIAACPPTHTLCHLCLLCFLSCRWVLDSLVSLVVLDNRHDGEHKSWVDGPSHITPHAHHQMRPHLLTQWRQHCQAHPWHLEILSHPEGLEDPLLQAVLKVKS